MASRREGRCSVHIVRRRIQWNGENGLSWSTGAFGAGAVSVAEKFNERTGTCFNHLQYPTDVVCLVVLWRVRYKLS